MPLVAHCVPQQLSSMFVAIPKYFQWRLSEEIPMGLSLGISLLAVSMPDCLGP